MIRTVVSFLLLAPEGLSQRKEKEWDKEHETILKRLGAKLTIRGDYEVEATRPRIAELLSLLQQWRRQGARVNGYGLAEVLVDDDKTPVEWFIVDPTGRSNDEGLETLCWDLQEPVVDDDIHLRIRADRMKPGVHVAGWSPLLYVSERFKAVVEAHRLTGIEFVWCRDVGKYRAPQWYLPICQQGLGRGLDHPWIDATKLSGEGSQALDPAGRHGQSSAFAEQYKRDAGPGDSLVKKLLRLLRSMELLKRPPDFDSFPRYLRKYLPDTDFAYTIQNMYDSRQRGLAMNRKARDLLKANRIVTEDLCTPLLILNRPPKGVENLDRRHGTAEPAFSPEQMARIRELETTARAKHLANPKPPRAPDLVRSLALLRSRKRSTPMTFCKPATPKMIEEAGRALGAPIPEPWQNVLRLTNGGKIENSPLASDQACLIIPADKLAASQREEMKYYKDIRAELPKTLVLAMQTEIGDSVWLDTARQKPDGDCRVVLMSHETGEEEREWSSVAEFLEELLTADEG
jgi:hypothetical protein